jgi:hypothetical protein
MKTKIKIKSIWGRVLFEFEKDDNSVKSTLEQAVRKGANLYDANLRGADLHGANLHGANLYGADLHGADLRGANLHGADLHGADLYGANLRGANLRGADLHGADLRGANLHGADLQRLASQTSIVPQGELIVWKKLREGFVCKLLIPREAQRVNAVGSRKCRFEYAKVLEIRNAKGQLRKMGEGLFNKHLKYKVGEMVYPDAFDPSPLVECSSGIHAFITRQEAKEYQM